MHWLIYTLLAVFAVGGCVAGWWKGSRDLARPPDRHDRPIGVGRRDYERQLGTRYRRRRILWTIGGFFGGAGGGFAFLMLAAIRHWFG
jgi:hypothetical protein